MQDEYEELDTGVIAGQENGLTQQELLGVTVNNAVALQGELVEALAAGESSVVLANMRNTLLDNGFRFTSTESPILPYSPVPTVIPEELYQVYRQQDSIVNAASWSLIATLSPTEHATLYSGFRDAERSLVDASLAQRRELGLMNPMYRRTDRMGDGSDLLLGEEMTTMKWLEDNANSPDAGSFQLAIARATNMHLLPHLRDITGYELPDMPVAWDALLGQMHLVAETHGRELNSVGIVYLEAGNHIAKDNEIPRLQQYLTAKGVRADIITQHDIAAHASLGEHDVYFKAFDTSHKLTDDGLLSVARLLSEANVPMVGDLSETLFGAKTLMGLLSRAARSGDSRLSLEQRNAVNEAMGWKDVIHLGNIEEIITPEGQAVHWKEFLAEHGEEIYLKLNMGGSGYAVIRVDGKVITSSAELITAAEKVMNETGYALEVEGMKTSRQRSFLHDVNGGSAPVMGVMDNTLYNIGGLLPVGFGRYLIGDPDPRRLANATQGGGVSAAYVVKVV